MTAQDATSRTAPQRFLEEVRARHSAATVRQSVEALGRLRALVVGDLIIDEYCYCRVSGTVSKAPVIAAVYESIHRMAGGGAAIARHIKQFAGTTDYVCAVGGTDGHEDFIRSILDADGIRMQAFRIPGAHTVTKRRYITGGYPSALTRIGRHATSNIRLFEIGYMPSQDLPAGVETAICDHLERVIGDYDLVVVADFGHGCVTPKIASVIAQNARWWAVNAQTNSSNFGFNLVTKYRAPSFVCIDELEARLPSGRRREALEVVVEDLRRQLSCHELMVTRGADGLILFDGELMYRAPAIATELIDTVGAGDAVLAVASLCRVARLDDALSVFLSACAGAVATSIVGNEEPVRRERLLEFATSALDEPASE